MGLKTNKPRGRNGGRPRKLSPEGRRELGRHANLLRRGAPIPSYELPSAGADDEWPLSDVAIAIVDAQALVAEGDYDGSINKRAANAAHKVIADNIRELDPSDLRERQLRRTRDERPEVDPVGLGPINPHWCAVTVEWAARHLGVKVGGDLVRAAESEYRQVVELWDKMINEDCE